GGGGDAARARGRGAGPVPAAAGGGRGGGAAEGERRDRGGAAVRARRPGGPRRALPPLRRLRPQADRFEPAVGGAGSHLADPPRILSRHARERGVSGLLVPLRIGRGDVVAVAGAGGKTTLIYRLAAQARRSGLRVLLTSTTPMGTLPEATTGPVLVEAEGDPQPGRERELSRGRLV